MLRKISTTGIILLLTVTFISAAGIDGIWQVKSSNDYVEIRKTNDGIKAKFVDSREWDFYEHLRRNTYEDRRGNRYVLQSSNNLIWESRDGRTNLKLKKSKDNYSYNNNQRGNSKYDYDDYDYDYNDRNNRRSGSRNDDYNRRGSRYDDYNRRGNRNNRYEDMYCTSSCNANCKVHSRGKFRGKDRHLVNQLSGTWHNRWRNTIAYVEYDGFVVRMKTNKSRKWTTYRRTNHRKLIFKDKWGNRLKFKNNGELEWKRSDGRREIEFNKRYY